MDKTTSLRKNPSREACEKIIRKILTTEVMQQGGNYHFKQAFDFMDYFESLYPASDGLTKQVQRAVKAMNLPKDKNGCFIINKTEEQIKQEDQLQSVLSSTCSLPAHMENLTPIFFPVHPSAKSYVMHLLQNSITFSNKIITIVESSNGLVIYTNEASALCRLLENFLI